MEDNHNILREYVRRRAEKQHATDDKIIIGGKPYDLERVQLFDGKISVLMPEIFSPMDEQVAVLKYPSDFRPKAIYAIDDGTAAITFSLTNTELTRNDMPAALAGCRSTTKKLHPAFTFYEYEADGEIGWFDYRSYAMDCDIYNVFFATSIDNTLLVGSFSCPYDERDAYKRSAKRIIASVREELPGDGQSYDVLEGAE